MKRHHPTTYVASNGIELAYDSFGSGSAETILLVSGLGAQMIRWSDSFCDCLAAKGFRVIRYDNRDCGRSSHFRSSPVPDFMLLASNLARGLKPVVPYTLDDMAADAVGLLDALFIARAHVIGRSMGGMIAQIMAISYPARVSSLAAIMSSTGNPALPQAAPDVMALMMGPSPDPIADQSAYLSHRLSFARRIAGTGHAFDEDAQRALILEELRHAYDPAGVGRQIGAIAATGDLRPRLAAVIAPTLVIHGSQDALVHPDCGRDIASSIDGAQLTIIDGMGHDLPVSLERHVIEAVLRNIMRASG